MPESLPSASVYDVQQGRLISQDNSVSWRQFKIVLIFSRVEMSTYLSLLKFPGRLCRFFSWSVITESDQFPLCGTKSDLKARSLWQGFVARGIGHTLVFVWKRRVFRKISNALFLQRKGVSVCSLIALYCFA